MLPQIPGVIVSSFMVAVILAGNVFAAPGPKNFLFEDADQDMTTELPVTEPVTSVEYITLEDGHNDLTEDSLMMAQPSEPAESIIASASSTSSSSSTNNAISGSSGKTTVSNQQANIILLQQLQEQLRRQQILQNKLLPQPQQQVSQQQQLQQQPQFSLDALVKSFVKVFQVAKTKIDQGARTMRDILQFFDRKKYTTIIPQGSENNLVLT